MIQHSKRICWFPLNSVRQVEFDSLFGGVTCERELGKEVCEGFHGGECDCVQPGYNTGESV